MKKTKLKILIIVTAFSFLFGMTIPTATTIVQANEIANTEVDQSEDYLAADPIDSDIVVLQEGEYYEEEQRSQQALKVIAEEYAEEAEKTNVNAADEVANGDEYTLTPEDEARLNEATSAYLKMVGYNPRLRGFGRNWWNSRSFVGGVIDAVCIALGFGAGVKSAQKAAQLIRANRRNITRAVERQIKAYTGIKIGGYLSAGLDLVGALTGYSLGYMIAWGIDYVDGKRLDGYILA
jgi:hypothetical protein